MDYHLLFLAVSFVVFLLTIFLIFIDATFEKTVGAMILCAFNLVLNFLCALLFSAVDIFGFNASGEVVHNVQYSMHTMSVIFVGLMFLNIMLMVYCVYLFIRKPWTEVFGDEATEIFYQGPPY